MPRPSRSAPRSAPRSPGRGHRRATLALLLAAVLTATTAPGGPSSAARAARAASTTAPTAPTAPAPGAAAPAQPNIVVVMADDMRVDDLQFAPRISRLAGARGLTFANSFSPYPLCCPARSSFLSGRYAHGHGVLDNKDPYGYGSFDDSRTLATSLRQAGYRTGYVGKYLNGYGRATSRVTGGPSLGYVPRGWTDWQATTQYPPGTRVDGSRLRGGPYHYFTTPFVRNGLVDTSAYGEYQTEVVTRYATRTLRDFARQDSPSFLYLNYLAPHTGGPVEPDDPSRKAPVGDEDSGFETAARPEWVKGMFDEEIVRASGMPRDGSPAEADVSDKPVAFRGLPEMTDQERRALTVVTRQRAESVYAMDREVGRLVADLKRRDEWRDTVFVFTSDNGFFLGEHRKRTGKSFAHEPSLRVPLLLTGPGIRTGETRYDPVTTVDLTATLLDVAGAAPPGPQDGRSVWPTVIGGDRGWDRPVLTEAVGTLEVTVPDLPENPDGDARTPEVSTVRDRSTVPRVSAEPTRAGSTAAADVFDAGEPRDSIGLRTARWSYSLYRNGEGELYDLLRDPAQLENVYADPDHAEVRALLESERQRFADCAGQQCLEPLDPALRADADQVRVWTEAYLAGIDAIYGPHTG